MIHSFLGFELDERLFELRHQGRVIATQTRVFGMIAYLLHHRERVVSRDELVRELWQATVASDTAISQVVMLARKALNDQGDNQRIIKTVRGRGFRFIADVKVVEPGPSRASEPPPPTSAIVPSWAPKPSCLIGRAAELLVLKRAFAAAELGRGRLVLIEGEPGIGKTTLVANFAAELTASTYEVRWGRAWEGGGAPPYWPFIQVLRGIAQVEGHAAIRSFVEQGPTGIAALTAQGSDAPMQTPLDGNPLHARFRTFDAVARFLRELCGQAAAHGGIGTRLIILEDLHAADEATIELLRFLSTELHGTRLLIVGTLHALELAGNPALSQMAESLDETQRIRLDGLSHDEIAALLAQRVGHSVSNEVVTMLHELSGGNPLLLGEMCRHVGRDGLTSFIDPSALASMTPPERIANSIRKPLRDLPAATVQVLGAASVLSREFAIPLLAELCELSEVEVVSRLSPAVSRGLVRQRTGSDLRAFSHALVRSAVYAEQPADSRLELHLRVAQLLERRHRTSLPSRIPLFEIAHHYQQAAPLGYRRQALDYTRLAAQKACELTAFDVGASLYDRSLSLVEAEGDDPLLVHELLCNAGDAWVQAGRLMFAVERYERAASAARAENRVEHFAYAVLRIARALRANLFHNRARQQELQDALALLPETDSAVRANLLAVSALGMRGEDRLAQRDATTRAAVAMARRLQSDDTFVQTLTSRYLALWGLAHPSVSLEIANELVEATTRSTSGDQLLDALLFRLSNHTELGNLPAFWQDVERYACEVERRRSPWHAYVLRIFAGAEASQRGDFVTSEQCSLEALHLGQRIHDELAEAYHAVRSLFLQLDRGVRQTRVTTDGEDLPDEPPDFVPEDYHAFWALLWVTRGHHTRARHAMTRLFRAKWQHLVAEPLRRPLLAVAGQVCAALGERAYLEQIYASLLPDLGLHLVLQAGVSLGPVSYYLGTVAAALDRHAEAEAHLCQAVEESRPGTWHLRCKSQYGRLLARRDPSRARELLLEARDGADQLGMRDLLEDVQQVLEHDLFACPVAS